LTSLYKQSRCASSKGAVLGVSEISYTTNACFLLASRNGAWQTHIKMLRKLEIQKSHLPRSCVKHGCESKIFYIQIRHRVQHETRRWCRLGEDLAWAVFYGWDMRKSSAPGSNSDSPKPSWMVSSLIANDNEPIMSHGPGNQMNSAMLGAYLPEPLIERKKLAVFLVETVLYSPYDWQKHNDMSLLCRTSGPALADLLFDVAFDLSA